MEFIDLTE
jgi:hypothetical protein